MAKTGKAIFWVPRILAILFALFLTLFSFDVFGNGYGFWGTILAFIIHNIPSIILATLVWVSWKRELVGAITFFSAGMLYIVSLLMRPPYHWYYLLWILIIAGPAFLIGILFLMGWKRKRKR